MTCAKIAQHVNKSFPPYRNFSEAVLDIYNCKSVHLESVSLSDNSGEGRLLEPVRGNSGGVAIGYNMLPMDYIQSTLTMSNCHFLRNQARGFISAEVAVASQLYRGRGGGVAVYMNESYTAIHINITDCVFEGNYANVWGGGFYLITNSYPSVQHIIRVERSRFFENRANFGTGGISFSFLRGGDESRPHTAVLSDCSFEGNMGASGAAFYGFIGEFVCYVYRRISYTCAHQSYALYCCCVVVASQVAFRNCCCVCNSMERVCNSMEHVYNSMEHACMHG